MAISDELISVRNWGCSHVWLHQSWTWSSLDRATLEPQNPLTWPPVSGRKWEDWCRNRINIFPKLSHWLATQKKKQWGRPNSEKQTHTHVHARFEIQFAYTPPSQTSKGSSVFRSCMLSERKLPLAPSRGRVGDSKAAGKMSKAAPPKAPPSTNKSTKKQEQDSGGAAGHCCPWPSQQYVCFIMILLAVCVNIWCVWPAETGVRVSSELVASVQSLVAVLEQQMSSLHHAVPQDCSCTQAPPQVAVRQQFTTVSIMYSMYSNALISTVRRGVYMTQNQSVWAGSAGYFRVMLPVLSLFR